MTDSRLGRAPRTDQEWVRDVHRRLQSLERKQTARAGAWVLSEQDGQPVFTKPGAAPLPAGQQRQTVEGAVAGDSPYVTPAPMETLVNMGDATLETDGGTIVLTVPSGSGVDIRLATKPLDRASFYTATAFVEAAMYPAGTVRAGLVLRESATGRFVLFGAAYDSGARLAANKYESPASGSGDYSSTAAGDLLYGVPRWLRIRDDGTDRHLEYSYNSVDWIHFYTVDRTDFLTPDEVGIAVMSRDSGQPAVLRMRSFAEDSG